MGKKTKSGKQRKDKYYHLAKETGYRSRAAFKLIQLNRKFEFLQRSRILIDLCAAPGGWLQVAAKHMPISSLIVGVDLVGIKPIHNVTTIMNDITTESCRTELKKHLKQWKADVVLNDGAPNVGKSWIHDAYAQNCLTLSALKLASEFLVKGGWFVTKVFRSKDYNALIWVFGKLFKKVHATKPQASRHESAEIFVVCQGFLAPDRIDPRFFNPTYIFEDVEDGEKAEKKRKEDFLKPANKQKRAKAEGYEPGQSIVFKDLKASQFIKSKEHVSLLSDCHQIVIDTPQIKNHPATTPEILECCKDIKVLGRKDLLGLIQWRKKVRNDLIKLEKERGKGKTSEEEAKDDVEENVDELELEDADERLKKLKKKRKKLLKDKRKLQKQEELKMVHKGDTLKEDSVGLFNLNRIRTARQLYAVNEVNLSDIDLDEEEDSDGEQIFTSKLALTNGKGLSGSDNDDDYEFEKDDEEDDDDEDNDNEDEGQDDDQDGGGLVYDFLDGQTKKERAMMFFEKGIFNEVNDEEDLEAELAEDVDPSKKKNEDLSRFDSDSDDELTGGYETDSALESEDDDDDQDDVDEDKPSKKNKKNIKKKELPKAVAKKCKKDVKLNPYEMALGAKMIESSKSRREIFDDGWNRYTRNDDEGLPAWFRRQEEVYWTKPLPVTEEEVDEYRLKDKSLNTNTIKKVVEAKARKKKRALRKMEKLKKKAEQITNSEDMSEKEKMVHLRNLYKKAYKGTKKDKEVTYVVANKGRRTNRPAGVKGRYKVVDRRLKKDKRAKARKEGKEKGKKRPPKHSRHPRR